MLRNRPAGLTQSSFDYTLVRALEPAGREAAAGAGGAGVPPGKATMKPKHAADSFDTFERTTALL